MSNIQEIQVGLIPGQGSYQPGALKSLWSSGGSVITEVFAQIDEVAADFLDRKLTPLIFADDAPALKAMVTDHPDLLQLAIFGQSVAAFQLLEKSGVRLAALVGHSFGEIAALVCAGAFNVAAGAEIVCHRNAALSTCRGPAGLMLALSCDRERAQELLTFLNRPQVVLAADNASGQVVVSGPRADVELAGEVAKAGGIGSAPVRSPYPFHNPMLAAASMDFTSRIAGYARLPLRHRVFSAILGRYYRDSDDLATMLGQHLVTPVRFRQAVDQLYDAGARIFVEIGGAKALTTLVKSDHPEVAALCPLADTAGDAGFTEAVQYLVDTSDPVRPGLPGPNAPLNPSPPAAAVPTDVGRTPAEPPEHMGEPAPAIPDRGVAGDDVLASLRTLYAEALDYPEDVLTSDARLEADLGIDSIKQTELMSRVGKRFMVDVKAQEADISALDTIGKVAEFVRRSKEIGA